MQQIWTHLAIKCIKGQSKQNQSQSIRHIQKLSRHLPEQFPNSVLLASFYNRVVYVFEFSGKKKSILSAVKLLFFFSEENETN